MRRGLALLLVALPVVALAAAGNSWVPLPGGSFRSALKYEDVRKVEVAPFELQKRPVTNAEFLAFVKSHPQWRRDRVATVLAEPRYLSHWAGADRLGEEALPEQPVVQVSWFAASAYCEAQGGRLPTWSEWEYAAAADETHRDARKDPVWRERILNWYSQPSNHALPRAGLQTPNAWGVQDLHGLVWEWTDDFSSLLVSSDNRVQGDADKLKFCGAGALSMDDRENYAVLMRVAMLSSLDAVDTTANLGFRCARDVK
ncbi:formylglycine-generating enzyme family protein [Luteimonas soli]|uniref:Formylglycine-generating enzyme family protein n=1 Tax=Luteimonas soli TaxID=1648966 RepID=A0ABV7XNQ5_9GAMM